MSQAALHAVLDNGEGLPDCPACGDNSYVCPAIVTDLDIGVEFEDTLMCCRFCRDPTFFFVDDNGSVFAQTPLCPCRIQLQLGRKNVQTNTWAADFIAECLLSIKIRPYSC